MPRRTIIIGRQPAQFDFQDDFGPLNNGLAYAAGQFLAAGRDRAQIETQQQAVEQQALRDQLEREDRNAQRQQDVNLRTQDLELRRKALGFQEDDRKTMRENQAEQTRQQKIRDAADAAAKWRDDIGSVGKYALDWMRGGNPAGVPKAATSSEDGRWQTSRDTTTGEVTFFRTTADGALEMIDPKTGQVVRRGVRGGAPAPEGVQPAVVGQPQDAGSGQGQPQPEQPGMISNWWENTKSGAQGLWDTITGGSFTGQPDAGTEQLSSVALNGNAATPPPPSVGSGQEQASRQFQAGAGGWGLFPGANFAAPQAPNEDAIISQRVQALSPDDRAAYNRIMKKGTPKAKAEARARILAAGK